MGGGGAAVLSPGRCKWTLFWSMWQDVERGCGVFCKSCATRCTVDAVLLLPPGELVDAL